MRLIFFFLSLIPLISSGQELPIFIEEPINESFLEHLIKEGIDSVRLSHSLSDLANDSILYNAARHHAIYLKKEDKLSHTEKGIMGFETPQQRAYSFGASNLYLVGENIALNQFLSPLRTGKGKISTYTQLANSIVNQWVNSPGHFKNIVTPKYNKTGLAVAINLADNSVFIVQKFAHVIFQYEFNENKKIFKYSTFQQRTVSQQFDTLSMNPHEGIHAWKVKSPENLKKYYEGNRIINSDPRLLEIIPNGRSIQVLTKGVEHLEKFIQNRKDGLAIELMSYEEYHCGNPEYYIAQSRRNLQCEFSGKLLRPVYKKKLNPKILYSYSSKFKSLNNTNPFLKAAFQSFQPKLKKHFNYKLAKIPKNQSGYIEFNLVYLKNNEVDFFSAHT